MKLTNVQLARLKSLAINSGKKNNLPNGALIVLNSGKIIGDSESLVATNTDATSHAERLVIEKVCRKERSPIISQYTLITILEPCLMCIGACYWAGIKNLYFILPSSKYFDQLPWITESKALDKETLIKKFEERMNYYRLKEYEKEFTKIFDRFVKQVIKRKV